MYKVVVNLRVITIDFNNPNTNEEVRYINTFDFYSNEPFEDNAEKLFNSIMQIKGDWASYDLFSNEKITVVDYDLMFTYPTLNTSDMNTVSIVTDIVKQFIDNIKIDLNLDNNFSDFNENVYNKGIILKISKPGEITTNFIEVENYLQKQNLEYSKISKSSSHAEMGASGGTSELLLCLASITVSGATWDMIKIGISQIISSHEKVPFQFIENQRFKKIRSIVSERSKIDKKELILYDFVVDEGKNKIKMVFRARRKYIYVCCDSKYKILSYKLSHRKVIEEMLIEKQS